jgi:predicted RNA-binding Zn-ribbon protein involved in translation (DUF1610 family)
MKESSGTAPFVCFSCRKQFERNWDSQTNFKKCPECGETTVRYDDKFRVPKRTEEAQWKKIEFLRDHGFYFQRVYDEIDEGTFQYANYPTDLNEAKEFVEKYKKYAIELE